MSDYHCHGDMTHVAYFKTCYFVYLSNKFKIFVLLKKMSHTIVDNQHIAMEKGYPENLL